MQSFISLDDYKDRVNSLSYRDLLDYRFRYVDFDAYLERTAEKVCSECEAFEVEADIGNYDCFVGLDISSPRCLRNCEIDFALRIAVAADMFLRDMLGR